MSSDAALYITTAIITSCGSIVCGGLCYFFRNTKYFGCCTREGVLIIIRKVSNAGNDDTTDVTTDVPISPKVTTPKLNITKQTTTTNNNNNKNSNRDTVTISEGGIKYSEFIGQLNK